MGLIELVVVIAIAGLIVWAITTLVPMPQPFKQAIYVVVVVALVLYVLQGFGLLTHFHDIRIGR